MNTKRIVTQEVDAMGFKQNWLRTTSLVDDGSFSILDGRELDMYPRRSV